MCDEVVLQYHKRMLKRASLQPHASERKKMTKVNVSTLLVSKRDVKQHWLFLCHGTLGYKQPDSCGGCWAALVAHLL